MFQSIFTNLKSWIIKIFLGLIALSFAAWGVGDIFRGNSDPVVASIGNVKVRASELTREYRQELERLRKISGGEVDAEQARALGIVERTLQQIINRASLDEQARSFSMRVPDTLVALEIRSTPTFRNQEGDFDRRMFEYAIAQNSMDEEGFIAALRGDITRAHLLDSLITGIKSPDVMTDAVEKFRAEQRVADFVIIDSNDVSTPASPNAQELTNFYQKNQRIFTKPEYRTVSYIPIRPVDLLDEISIDEDIIRSEYEYRIEEFVVPDQVDLDMVVFESEDVALRALDQIKQGENFIDVGVRETGIEKSDIKLGLVSSEYLVPELRDIAFNLLPGDLSNPIQSGFGWHLLRINDVVPGHTQEFTEARTGILEDLLIERAIDLVFELGNHFEDELAGGATLEEAARNLNLPIERLEMIDQKGLNPDGDPHSGLPSSPDFLETIFSIDKGVDAPLIEAPGNIMFKIRVDQIIKPAVEPLENVREQAVAAWSADQSDIQAKELAEGFEKRASEIGFIEANKEFGLERLTGAPFTRSGGGLEFQIDAQTVQAIFDLKIGETTKAIKIGEGRYAIGTLSDIIKTNQLPDNSVSNLTNELQQSLQNDILRTVQAVLRGRYDLKINDQLLDNLLQPGT